MPVQCVRCDIEERVGIGGIVSRRYLAIYEGGIHALKTRNESSRVQAFSYIQHSEFRRDLQEKGGNIISHYVKCNFTLAVSQ